MPTPKRSRLRKQLGQDVERFLKRHKMAPSRFGRDCLADPSFVFALRRGRPLLMETADTIYDFMADFEAQEARAA